jgi:hypothetical protein
VSHECFFDVDISKRDMRPGTGVESHSYKLTRHWETGTTLEVIPCKILYGFEVKAHMIFKLKLGTREGLNAQIRVPRLT